MQTAFHHFAFLLFTILIGCLIYKLSTVVIIFTTNTNHIFFVVPPRFTIRPHSKAEPSGSSPVYNCQADGDPVPTISWTKDDSAQPPTEQLKNGSLILRNIQKSDAGKYTCSASNSLKSATTRITISVYSKFTCYNSIYYIN